jgi:putative ABC transport system permease protein
MIYQESILIGIEGLRSHKLRSILTALGIIFGVAAVIAMLSIGEGAKEEALQQIQLMGMNNIIIDDVPVEDAEEGKGRSNLSRGLTHQDAYALSEINPLVKVGIPQRQVKSDVIYKQEKTEAMVVGTTPDYEIAMNYLTEDGAFFNYLDVLQGRRVAVLGADIKTGLFHFQNPLHETIKIGKSWYTVVGVMERKPSMSSGSGGAAQDLNKNIYIPITSAIKRFPRKIFESEVDRIIVEIKDADRIREAAQLVNAALQRRHNLVNDFTVTVPEALLKQRQKTQQIFNIVMGAIAGISLLVGGIGIMNIMLASVLERTREVGIRRAVGAQRKDILGQFLVEAVILSFVGGLIGVFFGFLLTKVIALYAGWRTIVSFSAIFLAFSVSAAVGIIFGIYPARKAAELDPIVALRYE